MPDVPGPCSASASLSGRSVSPQLDRLLPVSSCRLFYPKNIIFACGPQERLWKRRAAYHIGHAAAAEGRRRLEAAPAAAKEPAGKGASGRGSKAAKKEEAEQQQKEQQSIAGEVMLQMALMIVL